MTDILNLDGRELEKELSRIIKDAPQRRKFWTAKEDLVLKRLYKAGVGYDGIAKALDRSWESVQLRATRKLHLHLV